MANTPVDVAEALSAPTGAPRLPASSRPLAIVTILLAGILLAAAFRGVAWAEMWSTISNARPAILLGAFAALSGSCALRSLRWRLLLQQQVPLGRAPVFWATAVGYLGNNILPARAGEAIRLFLINRKARIGVGYALATILTERMVDAATLVMIIFSALLTLDDIPPWLRTAARGAAVLSAVGFVGLFIAPRLEATLDRLLHRLVLPAKMTTALDQLLHQFLAGVRSLQHPRLGATFAGFTALVWCVDTLAALLVARALNLPFTGTQLLLLLAALGLSSAVPSTPGYVGIYQFVAVTVLLPFGYSRIQALSFILAYQATTYLVVIIWGMLGMWQLGSGYRVGAIRAAATATAAKPRGLVPERPQQSSTDAESRHEHEDE